jgi:hypothetical protein
VTAQLRRRVKLARYVFIVLAFGLPARASGQGQDTAAARAVVKDLPLTAAQRQTYVGSYALTVPSGEQSSVRIFEENGVLKAHEENQNEPHRLVYQGDTVFLVEGMPGISLAFVVESGRATRFTVRTPDGPLGAVRVP